MINITRDKNIEIADEELIIDTKILLSPLIDSDCKVFILYLLFNSRFNDFRFTWSGFQARTGIKRRKVQKIRATLIDKYNLIALDIISRRGRECIEAITLNYSLLMNLLNQPVNRKRAVRKYKNISKYINKTREIEMEPDFESDTSHDEEDSS